MTTVLILIFVTVITILIWPIWSKFIREKLIERTYFWLTPNLTYFQNQAIFRNIFYLIYGILAILVLMIFQPIQFDEIFVVPSYNENTIYEWGFKILIESIFLFASMSAVVFICNAFLSLILFPENERKIDFTGTWMQMFMQVKPLKLLLVTMFLPVFVEELYFRVVLSLVFLNTLPISDNTLLIFVSAMLSTSFFITQQSLLLKTKKQVLVVGTTSFFMGLINSISFLLGASFYSLIFAHYAFVMYIIIQTKK